MTRLVALILIVVMAMSSSSAAQDETAQDEPSDNILGKAADWSLDDDPLGRDTLLVPAGTPLLEDPWDEAEQISTAPGGPLPIWESRRGWTRVITGDVAGWAKTGDDSLGPPIRLRIPQPAAPHEATIQTLASDRQVLPLALAILGSKRRRRDFGRFEVHTDVDSGRLLDLLESVAVQLPELYRHSYGLEAAPGDLESQPWGQLVLFEDGDGYDELRRRLGLPAERRIAGFAFGRVAVVAINERSRFDVARTLIHELTHVLNDRVFSSYRDDVVRAYDRPAPWLEEGLAEGLSISLIERRGTLDAQRIGYQVTSIGRTRRISGAVVDLAAMASKLRQDRLPSLAELVVMRRVDFLHGQDRSSRYMMSATLLRFLLESEALRESAVGFLRRVATGEVDSRALFEHLGIDAPTLEPQYRRWIERRFRKALRRVPGTHLD